MDHFADVNADVKSDVNVDVNADMIADVTISQTKPKPEWTKWLSLIFIFVCAIIAWKSKEIVHFLINSFNDLKHRFYKPAAPASAICKSDLMNDFIGSHMQSQNDALSQMEEMIVDSTQGEASDSLYMPFHTSPEPLFALHTSETQKHQGSVELPYECEEDNCELDQVLQEASISKQDEHKPLAPVHAPEHVPAPAPHPTPVTVPTTPEPAPPLAPEPPSHRAELVHVHKDPKPDVPGSSAPNEATAEAPAAGTEPIQSNVQDGGDIKKVRKRKPKMVDLVD